MDTQDVCMPVGSCFKGWRERFPSNPKLETYTQLITELEIELKKNAMICEDLKATINELLEDHLNSALEVGVQASIHNFPSFTKDVRRAAEFISEFAYDSDEDSEYSSSGETYEDAASDMDSLALCDDNSDNRSDKSVSEVLHELVPLEVKTEQGGGVISNDELCSVEEQVTTNLVIKQGSPSSLNAASFPNDEVPYADTVIKQDSPLSLNDSEEELFHNDDFSCDEAESINNAESGRPLSSNFLADSCLKTMSETSFEKRIINNIVSNQPFIHLHRVEETSDLNKMPSKNYDDTRITISGNSETKSVPTEIIVVNPNEEEGRQQKENLKPVDSEMSFTLQSTTTLTKKSQPKKKTPLSASTTGSAGKKFLSNKIPPSKCGLEVSYLQEDKIIDDDPDISCELHYTESPEKEKSPTTKQTPSPKFVTTSGGPEEKVLCEKMPQFYWNRNESGLEIESIQYNDTETSCELHYTPTPVKKRGRAKKEKISPKCVSSTPHKKMRLSDSNQNESGLQQENVLPTEEEMISAGLYSKVTPIKMGNQKQGRLKKESHKVVEDHLSEDEECNLDFERSSEECNSNMEVRDKDNKGDLTPLLEHHLNTLSESKVKSKKKVSPMKKRPRQMIKSSKGPKRLTAKQMMNLPMSAEKTVITDIPEEDPEITKVEIINTFLRAMRKTTDDDNIISALQRNYNCMYCEKAFLEKATLGKHLKRCTKNADSDEQKYKNKTPKKRYPCQLCGSKYFSSKGAFVRHNENQHNLKRPYKCLVCSWHFFNEEQLQLHCSSRHGISDAKQYKCPYCDIHYSRRFDLHYHCRRFHGGRKAFICSICLETFDDELVCKMHEQSHGYTCDVCMFVANSESELSMHIVTHLQVVSYKCDRCDRTFNRRNYFTKHMKVHKNEINFSYM